MNDFFPERKIVERLRVEYPPGCSVVLDEMHDQYRDLPAGLKGTVVAVDDAGTVHVSWENGSSLGAAYGVDRIHRVYKNTRVEYMYTDAANYHTQNQVVLNGTITPEQIQEILSFCEAKESFVPEQLGWPLMRDWEVTEDDHCIAVLRETDFKPTDEAATVDMTVDEAVAKFRKINNHWDYSTYTPVIEW